MLSLSSGNNKVQLRPVLNVLTLCVLVLYVLVLNVPPLDALGLYESETTHSSG